jgi:hypothetical protein
MFALQPFIEAIAAWNKKLKPIRKQLEKMAAASPWIELLPRGVGPLSLAGLIGEAGDFASYKNPSALWKRMGLGIVNGKAQRKYKDKKLALIRGYAPHRRSLMWVIGGCLIKSRSPLKQVYDQRKAYRLKQRWSKNHAHMDAQRYMTKRLLRDLWVEGQRIDHAVTTNGIRSPSPTNPLGDCPAHQTFENHSCYSQAATQT